MDVGGELQRELRKRLPFVDLEQEVALNLLRSSDFLQSVFARLFKQHGLSPAQYNVLRILRGAGGDGLPSLEIANRMITRVPDITRLVDRLERAGLVERRRTTEDRRVVLVRVTARALEILVGLDEPVLQLHRDQLRHFTREELAELNRLLVKARHRVAPASGTTG